MGLLSLIMFLREGRDKINICLCIIENYVKIEREKVLGFNEKYLGRNEFWEYFVVRIVYTLWGKKKSINSKV